jgi:SAM-dependent methyltransferase
VVLVTVDPRASTGFGGDMKATYARGRPSYPEEAVTAAAQALGLAPDGTVVDLAAGTGKLTGVLLPRFPHLIAVEPSDSMRAVLRRELPRLRVVDGTAEALPFADASIDAVFAAQAYHWFRPVETAREIARVLKPTGGLALLWNREAWDDNEHPWLEDFRALVAPHKPSPNDFPGGEDRWREALERLGRFAPVTDQTFEHVHALDPDGFTALIASWSWIANLPDDERQAILKRVRELLPDSELRLRYRTELHWTRQLASRPNRSRSR